jgi:hypothetical protein
MPLTGGNQAPFTLRHLVDDSDRCLPVTAVIDTRKGWMDCYLSKAVIHYYNTSLSWEDYSTYAVTT